MRSPSLMPRAIAVVSAQEGRGQDKGRPALPEEKGNICGSQRPPCSGPLRPWHPQSGMDTGSLGRGGGGQPSLGDSNVRKLSPSPSPYGLGERGTELTPGSGLVSGREDSGHSKGSARGRGLM